MSVVTSIHADYQMEKKIYIAINFSFIEICLKDYCLGKKIYQVVNFNQI